MSQLAKSTSSQYNSKHIMKIIDLYFEQNGWLYRHQFESYDQFMEEFIIFLKEGNHVVHEEYGKDNKIYRNRLTFDNVLIRPPTLENGDYMFPEHARKNSAPYDSKIICDVRQFLDIIEIATDKKESKEVYMLHLVGIK